MRLALQTTAAESGLGEEELAERAGRLAALLPGALESGMRPGDFFRLAVRIEDLADRLVLLKSLLPRANLARLVAGAPEVLGRGPEELREGKAACVATLGPGADLAELEAVIEAHPVLLDRAGEAAPAPRPRPAPRTAGATGRRRVTPPDPRARSGRGVRAGGRAADARVRAPPDSQVSAGSPAAAAPAPPALPPSLIPGRPPAVAPPPAPRAPPRPAPRRSIPGILTTTVALNDYHNARGDRDDDYLASIFRGR